MKEKICLNIKEQLKQIKNIFKKINNTSDIIEKKDSIKKELEEFLAQDILQKIIIDIFNFNYLKDLKDKNEIFKTKEIISQIKKGEKQINDINPYTLYKATFDSSIKYLKDNEINQILEKIYGSKGYIYHKSDPKNLKNFIQQIKNHLEKNNLYAVFISSIPYTYYFHSSDLGEDFIKENREKLSEINYFGLDITNLPTKNLLNNIKNWRGSLKFDPILKPLNLQKRIEKLEYENLEYVLENLIVYRTLNFIAPKLKLVGRELNIGQSKAFQMPELQIVGDSFTCAEVEIFNAPKLYRVGQNIYIRETKKFIAPELQFIGGALHSENAEYFYAPKLEHIGLELYLKNVKTFIAPSLSEIYTLFLPKEFKELIEEKLDQNSSFIEGKKNNLQIKIPKTLYQKLIKTNHIVWL